MTINKIIFMFIVTIFFYTVTNTAFGQDIMSPEQVIREIYDGYSSQRINSMTMDAYKLNIPEKKIEKLFTPNFLLTLKKDIDFEQKTQGVGALGYDPVCNCQDISDGIVINSIKIITINSNYIKAEVNFDILGGGDGKDMDNYFYLKKIKNRWLVDNIINIYKINLRKDYHY